jgi:hypothetical protein
MFPTTPALSLIAPFCLSAPSAHRRDLVAALLGLGIEPTPEVMRLFTARAAAAAAPASAAAGSADASAPRGGTAADRSRNIGGAAALSDGPDRRGADSFEETQDGAGGRGALLLLDDGGAAEGAAAGQQPQQPQRPFVDVDLPTVRVRALAGVLHPSRALAGRCACDVWRGVGTSRAGRLWRPKGSPAPGDALLPCVNACEAAVSRNFEDCYSALC